MTKTAQETRNAVSTHSVQVSALSLWVCEKFPQNSSKSCNPCIFAGLCGVCPQDTICNNKPPNPKCVPVIGKNRKVPRSLANWLLVYLHTSK
jgi:sulfatase maturation enzyme AslB (radical SAM superfamily)